MILTKNNLGEDQKTALDLIQKFIHSDLIHFALKGAAGTGKTAIMKFVIEYLFTNNIDYCLCAPTHKAALVLKKSTQQSTQTIHKLLALSPDLDIFNLDLNNLLFKINKSKLVMPKNGVIIVDEASMLSKDLFELLSVKCSDFNNKILFIGDPSQLNPVKDLDSSPALNVKNQFTLTKIYRQSENNGLLPTLQILRTNTLNKLTPTYKGQGKLGTTSNIKQFIEACVKMAKKSVDDKDVLKSKIIAYTNNRVAAYNQLIHQTLFDDEYGYGEIITIQENFRDNDVTLYNSMDYVVIDITPCDIWIPCLSEALPGYQLLLFDSLEETNLPVKVISNTVSDVVFSEMAVLIEDIRSSAIKSSGTRRSILWNKYYSNINSFLVPQDLILPDGRLVRKKSISYGYASTAHKCQGSSYDIVFIDWKDLNKCKDINVKRQLEYVSLSRTRTNAIVFQ